MDKELYSIGEISKIKGVTVKALRFYEKIGLLKPFEVNPTNQYRYYHIRQFVYIDIIKAARALDISPNVMIPYFQNEDTQGIIHLLSEHKKIAIQKINQLQETIEAIDHFSSSFTFAQECDCRGEIQTRKLSDRHIYVMPFEHGKEVGDYLVDYSKLDEAVSQQGLLNLYDQGAFYAKNESGEFAPKYIFTTISQPTPSDNCLHIPAGTFLSVCFNEETAQEQTDKIIGYLAEHEISPTHLLQVELTPNIFDLYSAQFEIQFRIDD